MSFVTSGWPIPRVARTGAPVWKARCCWRTGHSPSQGRSRAGSPALARERSLSTLLEILRADVLLLRARRLARHEEVIDGGPHHARWVDRDRPDVTGYHLGPLL